ncbi:MAG: EAL domain-containing protein, partial [Candidatus Dormibacteraeota bacterium]|nr:EAL domain-containing protein [Candidatus Dormibacteraeota bacterium]
MSNRALQALSALSREVARAGSRQELLTLSAECLRQAGIRSYFVELEGDSVRLFADSGEAESLARVERILGQPLSALGLRTHTFPVIHEAASRRRPATCDDLSASFANLLGHLSNRDRIALRREVGPGPSLALPVETGDDLIGVLLVWPASTAGAADMDGMLPFLEIVAAQLGPAWNRLDGAPSPEPRRGGAPRATPAALRRLVTGTGLRTALQPIERLLDSVTLGYEALCRVDPSSGPPQSPDRLFDDASACGLELELDAACLRTAVKSAGGTAPATLFLNITLPTLQQRGSADTLARLVEEAGVPTNNIVLEVSERFPVGNVARLRRIVADLRAKGFRIAIDDAGAGHASMLVIAEVRPDFIKIDRDLIHGIQSSASRRALVVSMLSFGTHINARVIAEGIETPADLRTLIDLGVQFGQGNVLSRPVIVGAAVEGAVLVEPAWFAARQVESFPAAVDPEQPARVRGVADPAASVEAQESLPHALSSAALALQAEHDPQRILSVIADQLQRVVPVDDLSIYAADHVNHRFVPAYATGRQAEEIMEDVFSMSVGVTGWAFASGAPQNLGNAGAHPAAAAVPNTPFEHESLLLIPLVAGDHKLGMLNCRRMGLNRFSDEDFEAATLFGHTAAAAWHNAQLYEELERRAMTDNLTGLFNSRWLHEAGDREIADARRRRS